MTEEILDSEEKEVAPQELNENDSNEVVEEVVDTESQKREEEQERNWRQMRQRQKEMEFELKQKDEILNKFLANQNQSQPVKEEVEEPIDWEEYANYGGVQKVTKKTVKPLEDKISQLEERLERQAQITLKDNFMKSYPDFDDVVNVETLELLEKKEPELAASIAELKDPYKMGLQSYKFIKALGLVDTLPSERRAKEVDKKIAQKKNTVASPQSYDKRPIAQAFKSTAADKKRLYEEMMHYASQA